MNDVELLAAFKARTLDDEGVDRIKRLVEKLARGVFKDFARFDAETRSDLVGETFFRVWRGIPRQNMTKMSTFNVYVRRIALRVALTHIKSRQFRMTSTSLSLDEKRDDSAPRLDKIAGENFRAPEPIHRALARAIMSLSPVHREALLMYAQDEEHEDIAAALNIPVNTVKTRLRRARGRIQEDLLRNAPDLYEKYAEGRTLIIGPNWRCEARKKDEPLPEMPEVSNYRN